jgi:hypothetical protein
MDFRLLPLIFGVAAAISMIVVGFTSLSLYAPLIAFGIAVAGWIVTRERIDAKAFERGFMDFVYTQYSTSLRGRLLFTTPWRTP